MSAPMCGDVRELAPELALGIVGGPERADALQHASECGPCRALVGELAEAADALTLLAPESEPPPGFEERVLAALKAPRRRMRRRAAVMVAAAAAAAAIVSIRDERGAWGGVVTLPGGATGSVVLVGADGAVVCEARLSPAT